MRSTEKAVAIRRLQGEVSQYFLYKYVSRYEGLSIYEPAKRLGRSYRKVSKEEKVTYPHRKLVYATKWQDIPDSYP